MRKRRPDISFFEPVKPDKHKVEKILLHAPKGLTLDAVALLLSKEDVNTLRWLRRQWGEPKRVEAENETQYAWDVAAIIQAGWGRSSTPEIKNKIVRRVMHEPM
jgi:hypothetical protein